MSQPHRSARLWSADRRVTFSVAMLLCLVQVIGLCPLRHVAGALAAAAPPDTLGAVETTDTGVMELISVINALKAAREKDELRGWLSGVVQDPSRPEAVLRRAYCELILLDWSADNPRPAIAAARGALYRFPDLRPALPDFPPEVTAICDDLRNEMFGTLVIADPAGCRVYLNGELRGTADVKIAYVPAGSVELLITMDGYQDYRRTIEIEGGRVWNQAIVLEEKRGTGWWLTRIGVGAVAAVGAVLAIGGGSGDAPGGETVPDLPGPPDPPGK
ncbi:MAG: PEGA domain-containing protein [bacterium]|nr:PEGA domain-containing protein [bacterium]